MGLSDESMEIAEERDEMKGEALARETVDVADVAARMGVAPATIYRAIRRGELDAVRIGRRILVIRTSVDRLLEQ